ASAVMGVFCKDGIKAPMLAAGADVEAVVAWMNANGFAVQMLGPRPGSASAVKMGRSVLMKGIEALAVESLVTAERQGILEEVLGCFGDADLVDFRDLIATLTQTHTVHARRRWEEMGLVGRTFRGTRVDPLMTEATERNLRRSVDADVAQADGDD